MAVYQKYGIKYPFTCNNEDNVFLDLNNTEIDDVKSKVLHVVFTPKGQKIRDTEFGTDLIKYIFSQNDEYSAGEIKDEIRTQISKYVPNVEFRGFNVYKDEEDENSIIVSIEYGVQNGNNVDVTTIGVKL